MFDTSEVSDGQRGFLVGRRAILSVLLAITLFGCSDSAAPGNSYYVRYKSNGVSVEFAEQNLLEGFFGIQGNVQSGQFSANRTGAAEVLQLTVKRAGPIGTATFSGSTLVGGSQVAALIDYVSPTGTVYRSDAEPTVTITITEITDSTVRGEFQGTVRAIGSSSIDLTQGVFLVRRVY